MDSLPVQEGPDGPVYMNPLHISTEARDNMQKQSRMLRTLNSAREVQLKRCTIFTVGMYVLFSTFVSLFGLGFVYFIDTAKAEVFQVGLVSITICGILCSSRALKMYEEENGISKSRLVLIPSLVLFFVVIVLGMIHAYTNAPESDSTTSSSSKVLETRSCVVLWDLEPFGNKGVCINLEKSSLYEKFDTVSTEMFNRTFRIKELVVLGKMTQNLLSYLEVYMQETTSEECRNFIYDMMCFVVFPKCDSGCQETRLCEDVVCKEYKDACRTIEDKDMLYSIKDVLPLILEENHAYRKIMQGSVESYNFENLDSDQKFNILDVVVERFLARLKSLTESETCHDTIAYNCWNIKSRNWEFNTTGNCSRASIERVGRYHSHTTREAKPSFSIWRYPTVLGSFTLVIISNVGIFCRLRRYHTRSKLRLSTTSGWTMIATRATDTYRLCACSVFCLLVSLCSFWFATLQESLIAPARLSNDPLVYVYIWLGVYYGIGIAAFGQIVYCLTSIVRGVRFVQRKRNQSGLRNSHNLVKFCFGMYQGLFSLRSGILFYQKMFVSESLEILLQYIAFIDICKDANLYHVFSFQVTLLVNALLILIFHVFRDRLRSSAKGKKIAMYMLDSTVEIIYLFINLNRGGDIPDSIETEFLRNAAIIFPCGMLVLKSRTIIRAILFRVPEFESTKLGRQQRSMLSRIEKIKPLMRRLEKVVCFVFSIACVALVGSQLYDLWTVFFDCERELTTQLWQSAKPRKMFSNGLFKGATCAYARIKSIDAVGMGISGIPDAIGKCTNLEEVYLANNQITTLPVGLVGLKTVKKASFVGNPVFKTLNLDSVLAHHQGFSTFPPKFVCEHLNELVVLNASFNNIVEISSCIKEFKELRVLELGGNKIVSNGISREMLRLDQSCKVYLKGSPVASRLVWKNEGLQSAAAVMGFVERNLKHTLVHLDLSKNKGLKDGNKILETVSSFKLLKSLNISHCDIQGLSLPRRSYSVDFTSMTSFETLDCSNNPGFKLVGAKIAEFFESSKVRSIDLSNTKVNIISWLNLHILPTKVLDQVKQSVFSFVLTHSNFGNIDFSYFCAYRQLRTFVLENVTLSSSIAELPDCFKDFKTLTLMGVRSNFTFKWKPFLWNVTSVTIDLQHWVNKGWDDIVLPQSPSTIEWFSIYGINKQSELPIFRASVFPNLKIFQCEKSSMFGNLKFFNISTVKLFSIASTTSASFGGSIPNAFMTSGNMEVIKLNGNKGITGVLPAASDSALQRLDCLFLHGTSLTGSVPLNYMERLGGLLTLPLFNGTFGFNISNLVKNSNGMCSKGSSAFDTCSYSNMTCSVTNKGSSKYITCWRKGKDTIENCGERNSDGQWVVFDSLDYWF